MQRYLNGWHRYFDPLQRYLNGWHRYFVVVALLFMSFYALQGSSRIWLARQSQEWSGGELIKVRWNHFFILFLFLPISLSIWHIYLSISYISIFLFHCIVTDTEAWAPKISLERSNCLGLGDVLLGRLALLGFILLLEVYSVDLCFFFLSLEIMPS